MSDLTIGYLYNMTFSTQRGVRQHTAEGDWQLNLQPYLSGVPCHMDRLVEREAQFSGRFEGQVTDVLNCPANTDVQRGDVVTTSRGVTARVMEVYDASNVGHHLICYLDRRELGG